MSEKNADRISITSSETYDSKGVVIYRKRVAGLDLALLPGETQLAGLRRAESILQTFHQVDAAQTGIEKIGQEPPIVPQPGSVASVTDEQLLAAMDSINWKENKSGKGWHCRIEEVPFGPLRAALLNKFNTSTYKTIILGNFNYSRFGDANDMLGKFKHEAKKQ